MLLLCFCVLSLTRSTGSFPSPRLLLELPSPSALAVPAVVVAVLPAAVVDSVLVVVPPAVVVDSVPPVAAVASAVVLPVAVVASVVVAVLPVVVVASVVADIRSDDPMYCLLMAFGGYGSFVQEYLFRLLVHPAQLQLKWLQAVEYHQSKNLSVQIFNGSWSFIVVLAINPCSINGCLHKRPQPPVMWLSHRLTAFACSLENDVDRSEVRLSTLQAGLAVILQFFYPSVSLLSPTKVTSLPSINITPHLISV